MSTEDNKLLYKVAMGIASFLLITMVGLLITRIDSQGKEITQSKIEIVKMQTQYNSIDQRLSDIMIQLKENGRKLDRHTENSAK